MGNRDKMPRRRFKVTREGGSRYVVTKTPNPDDIKPPEPEPDWPSQEVRDVIRWALIPSIVLAALAYLMFRAIFHG